ncbi:hypothetical protein TSUD_59960 [Trifolium subterraneum]|uniref:Replication factor A C-terminal domain-containing protein n=1 Tax=Trifolium subterraneum TaxID=3900 RepID=A0A2Z6NQS2_TRISU|nr:hypothetical protein TSUD_59960 [Trifolium subterraneum]
MGEYKVCHRQGLVSRVVEFVGNEEIKNLSCLCNSNDEGVFVVAAWFDSVVDGVHLRFPRDDTSAEPRFKVSIKFRDSFNEVVFVFFDDQVKKMAFETYRVLGSIGESCSMYPKEMDVLYGDVFVFKAKKKLGVGSFKVLEFISDPILVDIFLEEYMSDVDGSFADISHPDDAFSSTENCFAIVKSEGGCSTRNRSESLESVGDVNIPK